MRLAIAAALAVQLLGCGNRCKDVQHARAALQRQGAPNRGADVRVTLPYDQTNRVIAGLLAQQPVTMELAPPEIRLFPVSVRPVAIVREAVLQEDRVDGQVRIATRFEIRDGDTLITDVAAVIEVRPVLDGNELVIGFGPQNLVRVKPTLGPEAKQTLSGAVERWVPERLRGKIPRFALDSAARQLGIELTETAWEALRGTLMKRLGEVTRTRIRLPEVPIARHTIRSTPVGLIVDLETDLPVRRGLAPGNGVVGPDVGVRISGSAAAELANWALDQGHGPQRFTRTLKPSASGDYEPRFDYLAEDRKHPLKVYSFQQRGGCSFHKVGVRGTIDCAQAIGVDCRRVRRGSRGGITARAYGCRRTNAVATRAARRDPRLARRPDPRARRTRAVEVRRALRSPAEPWRGPRAVARAGIEPGPRPW